MAERTLRNLFATLRATPGDLLTLSAVADYFDETGTYQDAAYGARWCAKRGKYPLYYRRGASNPWVWFRDDMKIAGGWASESERYHFGLEARHAHLPVYVFIEAKLSIASVLRFYFLGSPTYRAALTVLGYALKKIRSVVEI